MNNLQETNSEELEYQNNTDGTLNEKDDKENYKDLYLKVKSESIARKEKLKEVMSNKNLLEEKLKEYNNMIQEHDSTINSERETYEKIIASKTEEIEKLKAEYQPIANEVEQLRAVQTKLRETEQLRRETLMNEIKSVSEVLKDDSYSVIAEALPDTEKLELFFKAISQLGKKLPLYNGKTGTSPKPAGEAINPDSIVELQRLYREDRERYNQTINNIRR